MKDVYDEVFKEREDVVAIDLSEDLINVAQKIYDEFYKDKCNVSYKQFIKVLKDCLIVSQQKIEEQLITSKIIVPNRIDDELNWPDGVIFMKFEEVLLTNLKLKKIKKYIEMAGDPNIYLVIDVVGANNSGINSFKLIGFLLFQKSPSE